MATIQQRPESSAAPVQTTSAPAPAPPSNQPLPLKHLLKDYTTAHPLRSPSPLPPSSRVDPGLTQRLPPPTSASPLLWTLSTWWLFVRFVLTKGFHVIWNLLCHFLVGPKRKSWGYRMTLITSFMRNIADHSTLADIVLIRRFISLHFLVPLPGDAVVTPITFTVPRRKESQVNPRGFLRDLDLLESGRRQLSGEWVVGTDVWKRLKAERRARNRRKQPSHLANSNPKANTPSSAATGLHQSTFLPVGPSRGADVNKNGDGIRSASTGSGADTDSEYTRNGGTSGERVIYYVHGGAYYVGNAATHRLVTIGVSKACNARVFAITYRLAPEHTFPLPLHDVLQGYLRLLSAPLSIPPENIIIAGDSAGGGLSLALCMYLRDEGYKLPAGLVLMSPWVDLTMSCGSWDENAGSDVVPRPEADDHLNPVGCYLGPKGISKYLTHPYASPLFGDLHGLPPMLIQSGDSEVLRDEITLLAHKATLSGVHVTHELYEDMVHVFQMFSFLPATGAAIGNVGKWVRRTLPQVKEDERRRAAAEGIPKTIDNADERTGAGAGAGAGMSKLGKEVEDELESEPRIVSGDGEELDVDVPFGQTEVLAEEIEGVAGLDQRSQTQAQAQARAEGQAHFQAQGPSRSRLRTPDRSAGALQLHTGSYDDLRQRAEEGQQPTVDVDSLPTSFNHDSDPGSNSSSRSGSPTPTDDRSRSPALELHGVPDLSDRALTHAFASASASQSQNAAATATAIWADNNVDKAMDPFSYRHTLPRLRRSQTATDPAGSSSNHHSYFGSPPPQPNFSINTDTSAPVNGNSGAGARRRRQTASLHVSPAHSAHTPSNPVSPTPSIRKRLRGSASSSMSISSMTNFNFAQPQSPPHAAVYAQPHPSTRARSRSHSDIFQLVEGYVEGGAANETTVFAPGGEIKSVGVLGEDGDANRDELEF